MNNQEKDLDQLLQEIETDLRERFEGGAPLIDDYPKRAMTGDYDHLLQVSMETVAITFASRPTEAPWQAEGRP
jgi:hypothetical protein